MSPDRAMEVFMAEFNAMRTAGGGLWIGVWHPFVSGRLSRWLRIEQMIEEMVATGDAWFAPLEDIAAHCLKMQSEGQVTLRRDVLPLYGGVSPIPDPMPSSMPGAPKRDSR
jgi:hypothetical protein